MTSARQSGSARWWHLPASRLGQRGLLSLPGLSCISPPDEDDIKTAFDANQPGRLIVSNKSSETYATASNFIDAYYCAAELINITNY